MYRSAYRSQTGMVYAMTNGADRNEVIALRRETDGMLTRVDAYETGGNGTGAMKVSSATPPNGIDPLTSQGSLTLSSDSGFLFAVNAGSNSISSFRVAESGGLTLVDVKPSGGAQPNSLAVCKDLLYVSNVGDAANNFASNVTGFRLSSDGHFTQIAGSSHSLSTPTAQPACVTFSPGGRLLVVTELTTNRLSVFYVNSDGTLTGPTVTPSSGPGPFGCRFLSTGLLLVAEAGANALSSYAVTTEGTLAVISGTIPSGQMASCWVAATPDERFAYTSNTASGTVTLYRIQGNGTLDVDGSMASMPAGAPIDSGISRDGRNFYVLNGNQGLISSFLINPDGQLTLLQVVMGQGLPDLGAQGLAVR